MNDEYLRERALVVRTIADKADPKRLLALADKYDARSGGPSHAVRQLPSVTINSQQHSNQSNGCGDTG
jgi:hypothetical protein